PTSRGRWCERFEKMRGRARGRPRETAIPLRQGFAECCSRGGHLRDLTIHFSNEAIGGRADFTTWRPARLARPEERRDLFQREAEDGRLADDLNPRDRRF